MNEATASSEKSVYALVTQLCSSLIKESEENLENFSLNCAKSIAFNILLKNNCKDVPDKEQLFQELQFASFELNLANKNKESKVVNQFIENFKDKPKGFEEVCWLLINLKNIDPDSESEKQKSEKNFFKIPKNSTKNVYLPSKSQQFLCLPSTETTPDEDCSFLTGILDTYTGKKKKTSLSQASREVKCIEAPEIVEIHARKHKTIYNWENINTEDTLNKSFSSDSSTPIQLHLSATQRHRILEIKSIPFEKLLNDVKLLTIGIESESFKRSSTDSLTFVMPEKFSSSDISDLSFFIEEFLEAGSCFRRLKTFTSKSPFNQSFIFEGFIFKAFGDSVIKFMNTYRDIVYSQNVESLLEFSKNTKNIRKILVHLTKFLMIHPQTTHRSKLPTGSDFLGFLYKEYTTIYNHDIKCFFIECLRSCCQIYFNNFHKWLFQGYVEDPHKELFIYFVDYYRPNTKYFFDKAYQIRKQSVPGFLQGCAETILLCGKYTMLLKSYNQVHPLFMLQKPSLKVCLTDIEMLELKEQCKDFLKQARAVCGKTISIEKILETRKSAKWEKFKIAEEASVRNLQAWRQEQEVRRLVINEKRELQRLELQEELKRIEERKLVRRMEEIQAERDYLDEVEEVEGREAERENAELRRRIKVYEKLNENIDENLGKREEIVGDLKACVSGLEGERMSKPDRSKDVVEKSNEKRENTEKLMRNVENSDQITKSQTQITNSPQILTNSPQIPTNSPQIPSSSPQIPTNSPQISTNSPQISTNSPQIPTNSPRISINSPQISKNSTHITKPSSTTTKSIEDSLNANELPPQTDEMNNVIPKTAQLTEAQRNKLKVLSHEYNFTTDEENGNSTVVTPTGEKSLTEAQRNKLKVLGHEFGMIEETKAPQISVQSCEAMTDLQRNRLKVLSHEFNIEKMSLDLLGVAPVQAIESPMSITSDHFNDSDTQKSTPEDMDKSQVLENVENDEDLELLKAFEDAVEKNRTSFLGINLDSLEIESKISYEHIKTTDTMALSRFLQMSLMSPVNSYMEILNNETLKMFVDELDILSHFKSLRNYFLMMNGEFSISICQKLFSRLESGVRPVELLNYQSLHSILDHALSNSRQDNNTDLLSFIVQNIPDKFELHSPAVLNMLTMSYKLDWPLTLILNPETMEQYQAIFNYLLKLKRISWVLEECFQILKELHKKHGQDLLRSPQFRHVQQIRHKMTHFVHCLENHVTRNVLQISWNAFVEDLKTAQSIHGIYRKHTNYLKRVLFLCLLNKKSVEFQKAIEGTFKVILKFHKHLKTKEWQRQDDYFIHPSYKKFEIDDTEIDQEVKYIIRMGNKIVRHGYQKEIYDLVYMINVNGFYDET